MIKKSRKQFVPDELKDDKYWARRRKNNIAAKRSRDARRQKENQIAMRARYLEKEVSTLCAYMQWDPSLIFTFASVTLERNTTSGGWAVKTGEHGLASTSIQIPGCVILNLTWAIREPQEKTKKTTKTTTLK